MTRRIAALLLLLTPLSSFAATPSPAPKRAAARPALPAAPKPQLYLSWNAPYGTQRAAANIDAACGDTSRVDTLYLSFDPGKDAPDFRGLSANLYFHAEEGATLADHWKKGSGINGSPLRVIFESDPEREFITLWTPQAAGAPFYDFVSGSGRLRIIYAISGGSGDGVKHGKVHGFARVLVRRPAEGASGCGVPMCVEWHSSWLAYNLKDEKDANKGDRWVSMNSPQGKVCDPIREVVGAKVWKPGGKPGKP